MKITLSELAEIYTEEAKDLTEKGLDVDSILLMTESAPLAQQYDAELDFIDRDGVIAVDLVCYFRNFTDDEKGERISTRRRVAELED